MRSFDMTPYRPYRTMGRSCQIRPIRDKQVTWSRPENRISPDGRFVSRPLKADDIAAAAELWRHAYPEVYGTDHDFILFPEDYPAHFILDDSWKHDCQVKKCCMLLAEEVATGRLVAGTIMTKFDKNLQIEYTFAGTHPDYRDQGLMSFISNSMSWMVRNSNAEYLTTFLETWHTITQTRTLKPGMGWQIAGIFPGNFTRWNGDNQEYRACEVYLYRFINEGEKYATKPEEWHLHPLVRCLWECLESINQELLTK